MFPLYFFPTVPSRFSHVVDEISISNFFQTPMIFKQYIWVCVFQIQRVSLSVTWARRSRRYKTRMHLDVTAINDHTPNTSLHTWRIDAPFILPLTQHREVRGRGRQFPFSKKKFLCAVLHLASGCRVSKSEFNRVSIRVSQRILISSASLPAE